MTYANVNGTRLYYEVIGSGDPLILLHGFTLSTEMWDDQIPVLAPHYQVVRYDLRGFGRSSVPDGEPYSHHEDLRALLKHLEITRAHLLGLSMGATIALEFALAYPETALSLILADPSGLAGFMWPEELRQLFTAINSAAQGGELALAKQRWLQAGWFGPARTQPAVFTRLEQMVADYSGWHFVHRNPLRPLTPPANDRLAEIKAPTLILLGELDLPFYNHPLADRLAESISSSRKVVMPGVGHIPNMEDPDSFNQMVRAFLAAQA